MRLLNIISSDFQQVRKNSAGGFSSPSPLLEPEKSAQLSVRCWVCTIALTELNRRTAFTGQKDKQRGLPLFWHLYFPKASQVLTRFPPKTKIQKKKFLHPLEKKTTKKRYICAVQECRNGKLGPNNLTSDSGELWPAAWLDVWRTISERRVSIRHFSPSTGGGAGGWKPMTHLCE